MQFPGLENSRAEQVWVLLGRSLILYIVYQILATTYGIFNGPLSKFPGPKKFAATPFFLVRALCRGEEHTWKQKLHEQYGPVVRVSPRELSYNTSQAWQDIYGLPKNGKGDLPKFPEFYLAPINGVRDIHSSINDRNHRRMRKTLAPAFSEKALKDQEPLLVNWVNLLAKKLKEKADAGETADLVSFYNFTTTDIMADLTFSDPLNMLEDGRYHPWFELTFGSMRELVIISSLQMFSGLSLAINYIFEILSNKTRFSVDRVDRRLQMNPDKPDFWSYILRKGEDGLSLNEMHSNAWTFMLAGTETSATLLSGLTFNLLKHPEVLQKIVKEIRATFNSAEDINIEALRSLPYLNACIEEALRIYPPAPTGFPRVTPEKGAYIDGQWVPPGVFVSVNQYAAYHNSNNFALPDEFIPERWLSDDKRFENDDKDALQPFSVGPRDCIGRILAYHEIRLILSRVLWEFDLTIDERSNDWANQKVMGQTSSLGQDHSKKWLWLKPNIQAIGSHDVTNFLRNTIQRD